MKKAYTDFSAYFESSQAVFIAAYDKVNPS